MQIASPSSYVTRPAARSFSLPCQALPPIVLALDFGLLLFASLAGEACYQYYTTKQFVLPDAAIGVGLMSAALFALLARLDGIYRIPSLLAPAPNLSRIVLTLAVGQLAVICVLFFLKVGLGESRGAMIASSAFAFILVPAGRAFAGVVFRYGIHQGVIRGRRVVTLGDAVELERLGEFDFIQFGIHELARIGLVGDSVSGGLSERDRSRVTRAIEASRLLHAAEFALVMPWNRDRELSEACSLLRVSPLPVRLYPDRKIRDVLRQQAARGVTEHFSVVVQRGPLNARERAVKRALDIAVAAVALIALAPLLLLTSLAIKLDSPGPVIFRQRRCGFDNREFVILKFRTMAVMEDNHSIVQAKRGDDRVTRVGRMLRRTSIDELPQLLNVLRGDMSVVGPRPHAVAHDDEYKGRISNYALRHHVKPGVTGAAQVVGLRGETQTLSQMERRVERDLWYINNWSLALDLKIMATTCVALLRHEAY